MKTNSYNRGMTLVEIAIVLVIIGIVIGLGTALVGPLTKRMKINDTKEVVNAAVDAIISYAATNSRLPCAGNDNTGFCSSVGDEFTPAVRNPNDAWGKPLYYAYDNRLTTAGSVCGRKTTLLTVRRCTDTGCTTPTDIPNVAFLVLSGGGNYNNQTTGTQGVTSATTINVYDPDIVIDNYSSLIPPFDPNRPEEYDDIVKWVNLDELRTKIGCQGAQLKILNNELPYGTANNLYPNNISVYADGGVPFATGGNYKWCIKGTMPTGMVNPTPGCPATTSCAVLVGEGATEWLQANSLSISGTPTTAGSYNITILVRDNNDNNPAQNNDNCAQKSFVITINPS